MRQGKRRGREREREIVVFSGLFFHFKNLVVIQKKRIPNSFILRFFFLEGLVLGLAARWRRRGRRRRRRNRSSPRLVLLRRAPWRRQRFFGFFCFFLRFCRRSSSFRRLRVPHGPPGQLRRQSAGKGPRGRRGRRRRRGRVFVFLFFFFGGSGGGRRQRRRSRSRIRTLRRRRRRSLFFFLFFLFDRNAQGPHLLSRFSSQGGLGSKGLGPREQGGRRRRG